MRTLVMALALLVVPTFAVAKPAPSPRASPTPALPAFDFGRCLASCGLRSSRCEGLCALQGERRALEAKTAQVCAAIAKGQRQKQPGGGPYVLTVAQTECPSRHPLGSEYVWMRTAKDCDQYVFGPAGAACDTSKQVWTDWPEWGGRPAP